MIQVNQQWGLEEEDFVFSVQNKEYAFFAHFVVGEYCIFSDPNQLKQDPSIPAKGFWLCISVN